MTNIPFDHPLITIGQNIPDAICLMGLDFTIECWNKGAEDMLGYTSDEIIGKHISLIIPAEIAQQEIEHCITVLNRDGKMFAYESVRLTKDGRRIPIELTAVALKREGVIAGYASIMRDITERKRMEQELAASEESLRTIFNSVNDAIFIHDIETGRILEVNDKFFELYGYSREEISGLDVQSLSAGTPGYAQEDALRLLQKAAAGEPQSFEWAAKGKTGKIFPIEVHLRRVRLKGSERILATVRDVTARKMSEEALKLTQFSVDHASVSIFLIDRNARIIYVNEQTCRSLGYSRIELTSMTVHDVDPHFPSSRWPDHWNDLKREGSLHFETEHRKKDGMLIPIDISVNYVSFGGNEYNWAFATDITERKKAEQKLRESEGKYRSIVDTSTEWIWEIDMQGRMTFNNPAVENILGYRAEELVGKRCFDLLYEEDRDAAARVVRQAREQKQGWRKCLLRWKHRDGTLRFIESNSVPILSETGELTGFRGSDHDVTELTRAEHALKQAYSELEIKVRERTQELAKANEELRMEVTERRRAVELIRKSKLLSDALNNLGTVIHSSLDIDQIMQRVVKEAAQTLKVDASMIGVFEHGLFRVRYVYKLPEAFSQRTLTSKELRAMDYAAEANDAVAFNDAANDQRLNIQFVREMGIRSLLVAPIIIKSTLTGALAFYGLVNRIEFSEEHLDFARKLGVSVSLALENARLYHELQESRALAESRLRELQTIYETAPVGLCFLDRNKRYVSINRRLAEINNISIQETLGRTVREVVADEAAARTIELFCDRTLETGRPVENAEILRKAETGLTVLSHFYPVRDQTGEVIGLNIVVQDITDRKRMEQALRTSERRLNAILNSIPDIAWMKDKEGRLILVNEAYGRSSGKDPESLIGKTDYDIWPPDQTEKYLADDREVMQRRIRKRIEEQLIEKDGAVKWLETIKTPVQNEAGDVVGTVGIARDITRRKRMEEEIRHMAQHDALTGLPNRRLFLDILHVELAQARRHRDKRAVLFLDLDRFKEVNDTLGHEAGDRLLQHVSARLKETVRESDTVARIGGDEFNMVLADIGRSEDVSEIALKIVDSVREPIRLNGHDLHMTTSIGISIYPDDSEEIETLLRYADIAMYHAKESGRNTFRFYNPSINIRSLERMKLESYLRQTVKRGELSVVYQPQIDIKTERISYAEALVRWNHPQRGFLEPGEFIPLAEETGFITTIDEWVLRTVCRQAAAWKQEGLNAFCMTVNLSARQFQNPDLVAMISSVLEETGMPPDCLDLEVTESTAMHNVERSASLLRELQGMGVHVSIDDFGTGYSSLNYLKKLPIERLKIDKSFIHDIATDPDDRAIISAVTSMAHQMGIKTVAEGVETEEQFAFVKAAGCDEVQGYLVSRPVPAEKFRELVHAEKY